MNRQRAYTLIFIIICLTGRMAGAFDLEDEWSSLQVHGFLSQGFLLSRENNFFAGTQDGTFQFNEFGITMSTALTDRLQAGLQFFFRDLGNVGNNEVDLDWAYGDFRWNDRLGVRAGKIKNPYGLYNETRDIDMLRTYIFLPSIYHESWRDAYLSVQGVGLYGYLPLHTVGELTYQVLYGDPNFAPEMSLAKWIADSSGLEINSFKKSDLFGINLDWQTPIGGLRLNGTFVAFDIDMTMSTTEYTQWATEGTPASISFQYQMNNTTIMVYSTEYAWDKLIVAAEYMRLLADIIVMGEPDDWNGQDSYYLSATYRLTDRLEIGAYYSVFNSDIDDRDGKKLEQQGLPRHRAWQKEVVLATRFDVNEHWTCKLEGHLTNGNALMLRRDNPDGFEENSFLIALKTTFNF